ncbi:Uncharacterized protein ALO80_05680 [Pseudomonas caricapapayae]|uniref:Uncharacterized protein n=1 Tax=Pseudomonas caricapapayae TaxID=46678 RepID=A0A0P9MGB1_9PSED|nr:Uncharacterized protein ALO80_05680 [Pseudomonas caricapapayae]RMM11390.1 hypothetical protein ALQ84_05479 [Pseudomonas caricapapayae]RMV91500.1 hypothetical protein ALP01_05177 [Pseudomonas caricapapayae]
MPGVVLNVIFGSDHSGLTTFAQRVFSGLQRFLGTQQAFANLGTQFIGLITCQRRGMREQFLSVGNQYLEVGSQDFLSILCGLAGHDFLRLGGIWMFRVPVIPEGSLRLPYRSIGLGGAAAPYSKSIGQEKPQPVEDWGSVFLAIGYAPHA